jgi:hypothetical protein
MIHLFKLLSNQESIAIGGILLFGAVVPTIVIDINKTSQPKPRKRYYDQFPYPSQPVKPKQPVYSTPKRISKCPFCSCEEDIDGNFCLQCDARQRLSMN